MLRSFDRNSVPCLNTLDYTWGELLIGSPQHRLAMFIHKQSTKLSSFLPEQ